MLEPDDTVPENRVCPSCDHELMQEFSTPYWKCGWSECPAAILGWTHESLWDFLDYLSKKYN